MWSPERVQQVENRGELRWDLIQRNIDRIAGMVNTLQAGFSGSSYRSGGQKTTIGPAGNDGTDGADGADGIDGVTSFERDVEPFVDETTEFGSYPISELGSGRRTWTLRCVDPGYEAVATFDCSTITNDTGGDWMLVYPISNRTATGTPDWAWEVWCDTVVVKFRARRVAAIGLSGD